MEIKIVSSTAGAPSGKLADAELHFADGILAGTKLVGISVWERRGNRDRSVSLPARQYSVNGERRQYTLLRAVDDVAAIDALKDRILRAYAEYEETEPGLASTGARSAVGAS
jgi:hypothetical protein